MKETKIHFFGPFGWSREASIPCIYDSPISSQSGIYLYTVPMPDGDEIVRYVGETGKSFAGRFKGHERSRLAGDYRIYDPEKLVLGEKVLLWGGIFLRYQEPKEGFAFRFARLKDVNTRFMGLMRFYLTPVTAGDTGGMLELEFRNRVEAALAHHFYTQGGVVGGFQDEDVQYLKASQLPTRRLEKLEWPSKDASLRVACSAEARIRCFPDQVIV